MQTKKFAKGHVIFRAGDKLEHISIITNGEIEGASDIHKYTLSKLDVLGLCDINRGVYTYTYTALSDVVLGQYPCKNPDALDVLVPENSDVSYMLLTYMSRYVTELFGYMAQLKQESEALLAFIREIYEEYCRLCKQYGAQQVALFDCAEAAGSPGDNTVPEQMYNFYAELNRLGADIRKSFFYGNPGIISKSLRVFIEDAGNIYSACAAKHNNLKLAASQLIHDGENDMFSLISRLHKDTAAVQGADFAVGALLASLTEKLTQLSEISVINPVYYRKRLEAYHNTPEDTGGEAAGEPPKATAAATAESGVDSPSALNPKLVGSLEEILLYADADKELADTFTQCVRDFAKVDDKSGSDDGVSDLRRALTKSFYAVYKLAFVKSLSDSAPSTVINMFLNFGYVDAGLAGHSNANYLFEVADSYKGDPGKGIYTIREWLTSIYRGEREPSKSEFDVDFKEYVRDLKNAKQIDAAEEKRLLTDQDAKLNYEIDSAFPVVSRVTYGKPSRFCPVFLADNVVRDLKDTIVTASAISEIVQEIRSIDFSAYCRETSYSDHKLNINEHINVEVIPNFIITPVLGLRGSMWQDIEGRVRTTPGRIFLPAFLEDNLQTMVTRLTGEFRWEICRRVQGTGWNDMTDPSLTSYFCDYLQFYMNNRNISMQTMTEIRNEVSAARNNYKTVFVSNYVMWIAYESKGMARLNEIALGILMTFCPFTSAIREKLKTSMRYTSAFNKYNVRKQKRVLHLTNLIKKLNQMGKPVPPELKKELEFWQQ